MKSHSRLTPYLLLAPAVIWVLVFSIWPFLNTVVLAFTDARPLKPAKFIGLTNFATLFSDFLAPSSCATSGEEGPRNFYFPDELLLPGHRLGCGGRYHLVLAVRLEGPY